VPAPYAYHWRLPLAPEWRDTPEEASPPGPITVAVNGVPLFHYERRSDVATHIAHYDPQFDTVVQGELEHCGGRAGQGDDDHYHDPPVCWMDRHEPARPVVFGLDGAPVYFGTGGSDFYGLGKYSELDDLPETSLDDCNAVQRSDGSYAHYTTRTPPALIGCRHGHEDPDPRIEPRPMRVQGEDAPCGGQVGEAMTTPVSDLKVASDGWIQLERDGFSGTGTSATRVRRDPGVPACDDFEVFAALGGLGTTQRHGRDRIGSPPPP